VRSRRYGVFSGRVLERKAETSGYSPHYYILVEGAGERYRVAVNTRSGTSHHRHAELLYLADNDFRGAATEHLVGVEGGFQEISSRHGGLALDYQRGGMFDRRAMRRIPANVPGPNNDLIDVLDERVRRAVADPAIRLHAYGTRWGPEEAPDFVFGFTPGNGIHDVHMNQGNRDEHWRDNRTWADGALLFHDPGRDRWSALFLAFQTQSWHTNDRGDPVPYPTRDGYDDETLDVTVKSPLRIVGAFVHPNERKTGVEHVAIRNDGARTHDLTGWSIRNHDGAGARLEGAVPPRRVRRFALPDDVPLSNRGGVIRLVDADGEEIDRVSYTRRQARQKHGSLTF
jgi:uncharacterized protein YukJ